MIESKTIRVTVHILSNLADSLPALRASSAAMDAQTQNIGRMPMPRGIGILPMNPKYSKKW